MTDQTYSTLCMLHKTLTNSKSTQYKLNKSALQNKCGLPATTNNSV